MRTRATLSGIFASVAILLVGWEAGMAAITNTTTGATTTTTGTSAAPTPAPSASAVPGAGASTSPAPATAPSGSFTGSSVNTRYGDVQVQIVVASGTITDVKALRLTDADGRSVQISTRAAPILRSEVLSSQSARVSSVGGATYTSDAYLSSLQSALDQAGL
ncbi:MAG: FMN-binding protein [Actinomycetota bacterium]